MSRFAAVAISALLAGVLSSTSAGAQTSSERAEQLYVEGKALAAGGNYAAACPKLEESLRLEAAIGTQFNLADCYEHTARPAKALAMFRDVVRVAQMSGKLERHQAAVDQVAKLEKTAPRIVVKLTSPPHDVHVESDGVTVEPSVYAAGIYVDPGDHVIRISARSYRTREKHVVADERSLPVEVVIPALEPDTLAVDTEPEPAPAPGGGLTVLHGVAIGVASVGLIGVGVGAVFGVTAMTKKAESGCAGADCSASTTDGARALHDARTAGTTSTIFFIAGGALVAGGAVLWIVAPSRTASKSASASAKLVVRGPALGVEGTW